VKRIGFRTAGWIATMSLVPMLTCVEADPIVVSPARTACVVSHEQTGNYEHWLNSVYAARVTAGYPYKHYRSYAIFNVGSLYGRRMISGNFKATCWSGDWWYFNDENPEMFGLYHVARSAADLLAIPEYKTPFYVPVTYNPSGLFGDLGGGTSYGSGSGGASDVGHTISVPLTAACLDAIRTANGQWVMGISPTSAAVKEYLGFTDVRLELSAYGSPVAGGGGVTFEIADPEISGSGSGAAAERGASLRCSATAAYESPASQDCEVRQQFFFSSSSGVEPRTVWVAVRVRGQLLATAGTASVDVSAQLRDLGDTVLGSGSWSDGISSSGLGDPQAKMVDHTFPVSAELTPGAAYKLISGMGVAADVAEPGGAAQALFGDTVETCMWGTPVTNLTAGLQSEPLEIVLTWDCVATNCQFTVETCTNLCTAGWIPVQPTNQWPISGTCWTTAVPTSASRFYRISTSP